jgi:hypothetical protein
VLGAQGHFFTLQGSQLQFGLATTLFGCGNLRTLMCRLASALHKDEAIGMNAKTSLRPPFVVVSFFVGLFRPAADIPV